MKPIPEIVAKVKLALLAMQRNSWEQGVTMQAFLEQGDRDTVIALAKEAAYRRVPDGRTAMIRPDEGVTDPCSVGEALIYASRETGDPELGDACDSLLRWALERAPRNGDGIVYHVAARPEFWVDSFYMLPPYLAAAGYPDEALRQIWGYAEALLDKNAGLLCHIWDDGARRFARDAFWGVGNGWAVAGIARVIDSLPASLAKERAALCAFARERVDSLLGYMRADGLFYDVVDDPSSFVETNLSQMLAYTIYRGLRSGWLPESAGTAGAAGVPGTLGTSGDYHAAADTMRAAARAKVDRFGLVRGVCGAPNFDKPGVAAEGQSFFLLMEAAADR
jgi:rhamnogalacturonyl hydrolase YesR